MKARAWKWVILSALTLVALDVAGLAMVAPHARELLAGPRARAVVHAGALALRNIELASFEAGAGLLARGGGAHERCVLLERVTSDGRTCTMTTRCVHVDRAARRAVDTASEMLPALEAVPAIETPAAPAAPTCPACPACPKGSCPYSGTKATQSPGSASVGLPLSRFMTTIE
jgi:hypothetical protein